MHPVESTDVLNLTKSSKMQKYQDNIVLKIARSANHQQFVGNFEEIILSSGHDHPNILTALGYNYSKGVNDEWVSYIFYPRMKISLADDILIKQKQRLYYTLPELVSHMIVILSVHEYLEEKNISHSNIKPENIFFSNELELKVSEIGSRSTYLTTSRDGSTISMYAAPELLFNTKNQLKDLILGDVWSVGVVFLEMCICERLGQEFREAPVEFMNDKIQFIQAAYGDGVVSLIKYMLQKVPEDRKAFKDCRVFLEQAYKDQFDLPEIVNPRQARRLLRENLLMRKELDDFEHTLKNKLALATTAIPEENEEERHMSTISRSDNGGPVTNHQRTKLTKFDNFYQIYETFIPSFDDLGHLDLLLKSKESHINKDGMKDAHKLVSKILNMKHLVVRTTEPHFSQKAGQLLSYLLSQIKSLEGLELYLTNSDITDQPMVDIALGATALEGLSKCVLAAGGTKITELGIRQISRWLLTQPKKMLELELFLWNTVLSDASIEELATNALANMTNLVSLCLSLNDTRVGDVGIESLVGYGISKLKNLRRLELALKDTFITDSTATAFSIGLSELDLLEDLELGLGNTKIQDTTIIGISQGLSHLTKLKRMSLYFWSTKISNDALKEFSVSLKKLKSLEKLLLSLRDTKVGDTGLEELNVAMKSRCFTDFEIYLRGTKIQTPVFVGLTSSAHSLTRLAIELSETAIYDPVIINLSQDVLSVCKSLKALDIQLWETFISDDAIAEISKPIGEMRILTELVLGLGNTRISDKGIKELNKCLAKLKNIHKYDLDFQNTEISYAGLTGLMSSSLTLRSLKISYGNTRVNDTSIKELCLSGLTKCKSLEKLELYLWSCNITDSCMKELASRILQPLAWSRIAPTERATRGYFKKLILYLSDTKITDVTMKELYSRCMETLAQLEYMEIDVTSTAVSNQGLKQIKSLKNSRRFDIKLG
jgi:serine/threonine protein kinase